MINKVKFLVDPQINGLEQKINAFFSSDEGRKIVKQPVVQLQYLDSNNPCVIANITYTISDK